MSVPHHHDGQRPSSGREEGHRHPMPDTVGRRLGVALLINLFIPAAQILGGIMAGSVALISDAIHNLSDFTGLGIAYGANRMARRGSTPRHTFGFRRLEVLAAVANAVLLGGASVVIAAEAIRRLMAPHPVQSLVVILLAGVGIVGNGISAWILHGESHRNLNVRGAFLHLVGDLMTSVGVLVGGVIMRFRPWPWVDPLLSLGIVIFILWSAYRLLRASIRILMNATPEHLDLTSVRRAMEEMPGVEGAHYLHAWDAGGGSVAFTGHVVVRDQAVSQSEGLVQKMKRMLLDRFGIDHAVLEVETRTCGNGTLLCEMACSPPGEGVEAPEAMEEKRPGTWGRRGLLAARLLLGGVFLYAGVGKILNPQAFAHAVYNYQILPDPLINLTALVLPWLELLLGLGLLLGLWLPGIILWVNALLLVFFLALLFNMVRGLDIHCGCFSTTSSGPPASMLWNLLRDLGLLLLGGYLLWGIFRFKGRPKAAPVAPEGV